MFTEKFIRDVVLPEIERSGGATVLTSPYGMPPSLLVMDKFQPPTWVVGMGVEPDVFRYRPKRKGTALVVLEAANLAYLRTNRDSWSGVGFWNNFGKLYVEPAAIFTNHYMAVEEAKRRGQMAIYAAHTGELEWLPQEAQPLVPVADR